MKFNILIIFYTGFLILNFFVINRTVLVCLVSKQLLTDTHTHTQKLPTAALNESIWTAVFELTWLYSTFHVCTCIVNEIIFTILHSMKSRKNKMAMLLVHITALHNV